jgi:hypothetical protein
MNGEQRPLTPRQIAGLRKALRAKNSEAMLANAQDAMSCIPEAESRAEAARYKVSALWFQQIAHENQTMNDRLEQILKRGTCSQDEWRAIGAGIMRLKAQADAIVAELEMGPNEGPGLR